MDNKITCPSCGISREPEEGESTDFKFKLCDSCIEFRDGKKSHSEEDVQEQIQRDIDKTIRRSYR